MTCPNCLKKFNPRIASTEEWLFLQHLDTVQHEYVLSNYDAPLCTDCTAAIRSNFYLFTPNPLKNTHHFYQPKRKQK